MKKISVRFALIVLGVSLLINVVLLSLYFFKINPLIKSLRSDLETTQNQLTTKDCERVYSQSKGFICLTKEEQKSLALSECSKNFRENLNEKVLSALKSVSDLEKLQQLSVKMCMQEKGFDY